MLTALNSLDTLIEAPAIEPITIAQAREHLRVTSAAEDGLIRLWIRAARQHVEEQTGRQLITATWEFWLNGWPTGDIELPHPPLQEVVSITYGDPAVSPETTIDAASYDVIAPQGPTCAPGRIHLRDGSSWPSVTAGPPDAVRIRYRAGYGDEPSSVPALLSTALLLIIGHFYQHRSEVHENTRGSLMELPYGVKAILLAFKYSALPIVPARRLA